MADHCPRSADGLINTFCPTLTLTGFDCPGTTTGKLSGASSSLLPACRGTPLIQAVRLPPCCCTMPLTVRARLLPPEPLSGSLEYSICARCSGGKNSRPSGSALPSVAVINPKAHKAILRVDSTLDFPLDRNSTLTPPSLPLSGEEQTEHSP